MLVEPEVNISAARGLGAVEAEGGGLEAEG